MIFAGIRVGVVIHNVLNSLLIVSLLKVVMCFFGHAVSFHANFNRTSFRVANNAFCL